MHSRNGAWRHLLAIVALITFALPLAVQSASPASAQVTTTPGAQAALIANAGRVDPYIAFNVLGASHTATFTCTNTAPTGVTFSTAGSAVGAGCYDVTATVTNESSGTSTPIVSATCNGVSNAGGFFGPTNQCGALLSTFRSLPAGTVFGSPIPGGVPAGAPPGTPAVCSVSSIPSGSGTPFVPSLNTAGPYYGLCTAPIVATSSTAGVTATECRNVGGSVGYPNSPTTGLPAGTGAYSGAVCVLPDPTAQASVTINPGAPDVYSIQFAGFVPAICPAGVTTAGAPNCGTTATGAPAGTSPTAGYVCPAGTGNGGGTNSGTGTTGPVVAAGALGLVGCFFNVTAQKKYVEVTTITLTPTTCGGALTFAEGLKSYFGPACVVTATVVGTTTIKSGVDCAAEASLIGTAAPTPTSSPAGDFPGGKYNCVNGSLIVEGIPLTGVPVTFTATGSGSFTNLGSLGTNCAGSVGATTFTGTSGVAATLCPTGPGTGTIQACATSALNTQPAVCSATTTFTFTQNIARVVPYVRWAGEKIALTKCFGPGFAGATVEFALKGNNPGLNATLLPVTTGGTTTTYSADAVFAPADAAGCATVIGYADGEGVMYVDAAIYSTPSGAAAAPLVNEHSFEVFYLKFDHLDLENIGTSNGTTAYTTYTTATALAPYFSKFLSGVPSPFFPLNTAGAGISGTLPATFNLPSPPGSGQVANGTSYGVPICAPQFVRALVHGYFEISGDPSGRPASNVTIPGAPTTGGTVTSYTLPAGRWVLPEDWPVLATFAGFSLPGNAGDFTPSSVLAWDLNSGFAFNPTGESPVICTSGSSTLQLGVPAATSGAITNFESGPCFGQDAAQQASSTTGTFYATAPAFNCAAGLTVGIGPFDATQSCTTTLTSSGAVASPSFPLTYTPSGGTAIGLTTGACGAAATTPCLIPSGPNSTYLPNGTLSEWDAPMPPAQISFGITNGPGYLGEVNKTGFYQIGPINLGTPSTAGSCPAGSQPTTVATTSAAGVAIPIGNCVTTLYPDPFYAEAIPASPLIPPVTNNGGYLWNSWNFSAGAVTTVSATGAFGTTAGGFVPGASTSATGAVLTGITGGPFLGGVNLTAVGVAGTGACSATSPTSVVVANGSGFAVGQTLEIFANTTSAGGGTTTVGETVAGDGTTVGPLTVTSVTPAPSFGPNAAAISFSEPTTGTPFAVCYAPGEVTVIAEQFGIPVTSAVPFQTGGFVTLIVNGHATTFPIASVDTTNNIVYLTNTAAVAAAFGPCITTAGGVNYGSGIARTVAGNPAGNPSCSPALLVPAGTIIEGGTAGGTGAGGVAATTPGGLITAAPASPYPFWQWIPSAPSATATPSSATVYSDNHGEAVVTLNTGVASLQLAPTNGTCPTGYGFLNTPTGGTCLYQFTNLGAGGFQNVATALNGLSASNPGCIATFPSGTTAPVAGATIGAQGPAQGQICINALGGIEFGAAATLGTTTVQAVADYPYTRGEHAPIASLPLIKVFQSRFAKSVNVSAGTPGPAGTTAYTVTITAQDVCGNPITAEPVQVYALGNSGAAVLAALSAGVVSTSSTSAVVTVNPAGTTGAGTATLSLEVLNTAIGNQGLVIKAVWPFERIERFYTVIGGQTTTGTVQQTYGPGWQQVGGPANSNFSVAEAVFSWDAVGGAYANATSAAGNLSSAPPACTGYWAYFAAAMTVSLPATSTSGQTAACTLAAGWNLVGNPFATPAKLPSGVTSYHWNGTSYDTVGVIGVGQSVWVYNDGTLNSLTLTAT